MGFRGTKVGNTTCIRWCWTPPSLLHSAEFAGRFVASAQLLSSAEWTTRTLTHSHTHTLVFSRLHRDQGDVLTLAPWFTCSLFWITKPKNTTISKTSNSGGISQLVPTLFTCYPLSFVLSDKLTEQSEASNIVIQLHTVGVSTHTHSSHKVCRALMSSLLTGQNIQISIQEYKISL